MCIETFQESGSQMVQESEENKDLSPTAGETVEETLETVELSEVEALSVAWCSLDEAIKCRFLKQVNEKAPRMLDNWMVHSGIEGIKRVVAAKRQDDIGSRLDALVADLDRASIWAYFFVDWFKHVKTYFNDFCTKIQQELAIAGCAQNEIEPRMIEAVRKRFHDDPFLELFVATVFFHNRQHDGPDEE